MEEFYKKNEVKFYFKTIFFDIFKKLQNTYSSNDLNLYIDKIKEDVIENKLENNDIIVDKNKIEIIKNNYINKEINSELLNELMKKYTNENDEMKLFIEKLNSDLSNCPNDYSKNNFLEMINSNEEIKDKVMNQYISSFIQITELIDIFFTNLIKSIDIMPYYIKCICKIIYILVDKKNDNKPNLEKIINLNIFFFDILIKNILEDPLYNTFTYEFSLNVITKNKIQLIKEILDKIFYAELFRKPDFIPFNIYIIEKFQSVIIFQKKLMNVKFPSFIDEIINNDEFEKTYEYDYFKENPDENFLYRNIYFKVNELISLLTNAEKCLKDIKINEKILAKFKLAEYQNHLEKLNSCEEIDLSGQENSKINFSEPRKIVNCYLLTDYIINKTKKIENINKFDTYKNNYFSIEALKADDELSKNKNDIIKIKNLLCGLLYNLSPLSKHNFTENNLSDINAILKTIQNNYMISSEISLENNSIPLIWYIDYLFENLKKIKFPLDFNIILKELEEDLSNSIKIIPFEDLDLFIEYHEQIKRDKNNYEKIQNVIKDININIKVGNIIRKECIVINLNNDLNNLKEEEKNFYNFMIDLLSKNDKYSNLYIDQKDNTYYNTINQFVNDFPNITRYQNSEIDNFNLIKEERIPEIIDSYFYFIKKNLFSKGIAENSNINDIFDKIYDYIFDNLYTKLFPKEQLIEDIKIFQNCFKHQWLEIKYLFEEEKNYVIENFLPESINYLKKFEEEKSPRKKMEYLKKIFDFIYKIGNFNNDKIELVDEELALLTLIVVKTQPLKLYSNCKFCELFYAKKGYMSNIISKLEMFCEKFRNNLSEKDFYNIDKDEYDINCKNIINKITEYI